MSKKNNQITPAKLRNILYTDLKALRKNKITCEQANTVARMSDSIMRTMYK